MEYWSNINNIYKYVHNPWMFKRGQRWPYSDSDTFGAFAYVVKLKSSVKYNWITDDIPKLLKKKNLPALQLPPIKVKRMRILDWWGWIGWWSRLESEVLGGLRLVGLAVHVVDLAEGDRVVVVLHPREPAGDRVVVVPLACAHLRLTWTWKRMNCLISLSQKSCKKIHLAQKTSDQCWLGWRTHQSLKSTIYPGVGQGSLGGSA